MSPHTREHQHTEHVAGQGAAARSVFRVLAVRLIVLLVSFVCGVSFAAAVVQTRVFPYFFVASVSEWARSLGERPYEEGSGPPGRWRHARTGTDARDLTDAQERELMKLMTLGYVEGSRPAPGESGVTVDTRRSAYAGLNVFTSGHGPEAFLLDMEGRTLHTWSLNFLAAWPDYDGPVEDPAGLLWRRVHLFENGDLLAIYDWLGLIKIDKNSRLLWARLGGDHHDLEVMDDGSIYVIERETGIIPRIDERHPVVEDFIAVLGPGGEPRKRISLLEAFERSPYAPLLEAMPRWGDIFHTNTIEVLDGSLAHVSPAFRKGNVLVCVREIDTIAVVDMEAETVVWALAGRWNRLHQPTVLTNGRILLFNNEAGDGRSEVVELDPFTQEVVWSYPGDAAIPFYSATCGSSQRLPNGNTLITESDNGRAIEVTPDRRIVWEFINPHRAGENNELIATLYEMIRLPADFSPDWLADPD